MLEGSKTDNLAISQFLLYKIWKKFTNKSFYTKKIFILKIFFRGCWVPPSVSQRLLISPDFPLRFLRGPNWSGEKNHFFVVSWPIRQFWRGLEVKEIFGHSWPVNRDTLWRYLWAPDTRNSACLANPKRLQKLVTLVLRYLHIFLETAGGMVDN